MVTVVIISSWNIVYAGKSKPLQLGDLYMNESTDGPGAEVQTQEETNLVHSELTKPPQEEANPSQLEGKMVLSRDMSKPDTEPAHEERNPSESSAPQVEECKATEI